MDLTVNQHFSRSLFTGFTQAVSLGLTTRFSDGFSKISKQQRHKQDDEYQEIISERSIFRST